VDQLRRAPAFAFNFAQTEELGPEDYCRPTGPWNADSPSGTLLRRDRNGWELQLSK
jgi:hypothetical protein